MEIVRTFSRLADIVGDGQTEVRSPLESNQPKVVVSMGGAAKPETLIVTRHAGIVEWLAQHGITGEIKPPPQVGRDDVTGKVVVGALPLHLAALALEVIVVDMPGLKPEQRGQDLTPAEMDAAGAQISRYVVRKVD